MIGDKGLNIRMTLSWRMASVVATGLVLLASPPPAQAQAGKFTNFDVRGATKTFPTDINDKGVITGYYAQSDTFHGFVRNKDGGITTFDPPGSTNTYPWGINGVGEIAGTFYDISSVSHGFLRRADGTITVFDPPASTNSHAGNINAGSTIAGYFFDSNSVGHGFLRRPTGQLVAFDPAGSIDTLSTGINKGGTVTGFYCTVTPCLDNTRGFLRAPAGQFVDFTVQGLGPTFPSAINLGGVVAGGYHYTGYARWEAFLRTPNGHFVKVRLSNTRTDFGDVNNNDWAVGSYETPAGYCCMYHGFARRPDGTILKFDDPDAAHGTDKGTWPIAINNGQLVTGYYTDANVHYHGFVVRLY